jgi:hypothetical protein
VFGTAWEYQCANAPAAFRSHQSLARVEVMIYQPAAGGLCRFLGVDGALSAPRSCRRPRPFEFLASGGANWSVRQQIPVPPGRYAIRSVAIDHLGHHQLRASSSAVTVTIG